MRDPWLLVLDNADDTALLADAMASWWTVGVVAHPERTRHDLGYQQRRASDDRGDAGPGCFGWDAWTTRRVRPC